MNVGTANNDEEFLVRHVRRLSAPRVGNLGGAFGWSLNQIQQFSTIPN